MGSITAGNEGFGNSYYGMGVCCALRSHALGGEGSCRAERDVERLLYLSRSSLILGSHLFCPCL